MNDEKPITIGDFSTRCADLFLELSVMLEGFDDDTDPAGIAEAIVARYLTYYLGSSVVDKFK